MEREIYNPITGQYELAYDDGIYESGSGGAPYPTPPFDAYAPPAPPAADNRPPPGRNQWGISVPSENPAGSGMDRDLAYWLQNGVTPQGNDQSIFDANGQLRPGWVRTARGYERTGGTGGTGGVIGGGTGDYTPPGGYNTGLTGLTNFSASGLRPLSSLWPGWEPPTFNAPPAFEYESFSAPTMADAENEPGYNFAATQGRKQVEATKAAQGVYKSGQTLKDIYSWASEFAKQNYGGVFDRKLRSYDTNRDNAASNYMTNYGVSRDVFDRGYNSYAGGYDSKRRFAELEYARDWDQAEAQRDTFKTIYTAGAD